MTINYISKYLRKPVRWYLNYNKTIHATFMMNWEGYYPPMSMCGRSGTVRPINLYKNEKIWQWIIDLEYHTNVCKYCQDNVLAQKEKGKRATK